jgi:glycosyltransferase involved in cell wall biosynthesis
VAYRPLVGSQSRPQDSTLTLEGERARFLRECAPLKAEFPNRNRLSLEPLSKIEYMTRKIKVLLLLHELSRTGAPRIALDALAAMRDEMDIRIIALRGGPFAEDCRAVGPLLILWKTSERGHIWQRVRNRFERSRWLLGLRNWDPDVIYINSVSALPIFQMERLPEVPAVLHVHELHTPLFPVMKECPELLARRPARYVAVSEAVRLALTSEFGIDHERISVIHEFVPEARLSATAGSRQRRPDDRCLVVGGAGMPAWRKGTSLWLQTAVEVRRLVGPSVRFVWVGVPEWPDPHWWEALSFRREVSLLGLEDVVELVPSTPKPLEEFARFDIFAMTSWEDPCPLVVLENMGLGTPVVCFAGGGGSAEVVADAGVVVAEFDPRAMARAIAELAADPRERARLGGLSRQRVRENFTDRVQVPKIQHELRSLLNSTSSFIPQNVSP